VDQNNKSNWGDWKEHVLRELKRLDDNNEKVLKKLDRLHVDIITLKVKSGMWGAGAGMLVGAFISSLISFVFQAKHS